MNSSIILSQLERCRNESVEVLYDIEKIKTIFRNSIIGQQSETIVVTGSITNRLVFLLGKQIYLSSINMPFLHIPVNKTFGLIKIIRSYNEYISLISLTELQVYRLHFPKVQIISLCHPENFPMPRFPLGISDIAEAIRECLYGEISLKDMQLGITNNEIINDFEKKMPNIVGISTTFGQQDILEELLVRLNSIPDNQPLIIVGGSLASLNHRRILIDFPNTIVALGEGELTMMEIIEYWYGLIHLDEVNNIAYINTSGEILYTPNKQTNFQPSFIPALDLLDSTIRSNGVMQLETSRGCTHACSFCPRNHKGKWRCNDPAFLDTVMPYIGSIYSRHPSIARKIFLVDEEIIGNYSDYNTNRIVKIANILHKHGFAFEASSRIDQVYRNDKDRSWHIARMTFWKHLVYSGLEKVLFGVESGVNSTLQRFNKGTSKEQIIYAIRILSACDIPVRYTYITFDPLMTFKELKDSYIFQGRKDLILNPLPSISNDNLFDLVHDEESVTSVKMGIPLYRKISYMLVSLEGLIASQYIEIAKENSLLGKEIISMGKQEMFFLNPQIGLLSHMSQLWIDRNFVLDYSLKSLIKITKKGKRKPIYELRSLIKDSSYSLLGKMIYIVDGDHRTIASLPLNHDEKKCLERLKIRWANCNEKLSSNHKNILLNLLELQLSTLSKEISNSLTELENQLPVEYRELIYDSFNTWKEITTFELINDF